MRRLFSLYSGLLAILILVCAPAAADDKADCENYKDAADAAVASCGRLIASGASKGTELAKLYDNRARAWASKDQIDRAIADFGEATRHDPTQVGAYYSRGYQWTRKGDTHRAIADYSEAIRLNPRHVLALFQRGMAYEKSGDLVKALADYYAANDADKRFSSAAMAIRRLEPKLGAKAPPAPASDDQTACANYAARPDAALAACSHLISAGAAGGAALAKLYSARASARAYQGEIDLAIADYGEAIRHDPKQVGAYYSRGFQLSRKNDFRGAIADYSEAIRRVPRHGLALEMRAVAYEKVGEFANALADFRKALEIDPNNDEAKQGINRLERNVSAPPTGSRSEVATGLRLPTAAPAPSSAPPALVAPSPAPNRARVALVIGNSDYRFAAKLINPANDAVDMAQALRRLGFDVVEGHDLDRAGMENGVREFGRKLDGADLALFFYAGHGMQVNGKNYLIPIDAKLERPGDLNLDTVDVSNVIAAMEAERRVNLVFLDACRDNPLARSFSRSLGTRSTAVGMGLATIQSAVGTLIAFATQPDNVALDGEGRNSPFTTALLRHLGDPGTDISVVLKRVRADVIAATKERQVPWDHSSLIGEVILAR